MKRTASAWNVNLDANATVGSSYLLRVPMLAAGVLRLDVLPVLAD